MSRQLKGISHQELFSNKLEEVFFWYFSNKLEEVFKWYFSNKLEEVSQKAFPK